MGLGATVRKSVMVAVVGLSLTGCGLATSYQIANMAPEELTKLSDADVCLPGQEIIPHSRPNGKNAISAIATPIISIAAAWA